MQNLLNVIDTSTYNVDVFTMVNEGQYAKDFNNCKILRSDKMLDALVGHYEYKNGAIKLLSAILKSINRVSKDKFRGWLYKKSSNALLRNKYDVVVAYSEGAPTEYVSYMRHKNKIAWIHCDYANYRASCPQREERKIYEQFKSVVCVSKYTLSTFLSYYPQLVSRGQAIYNILDAEIMKKKAREQPDIVMNTSQFNIVTIGRLDPVKNISVIPQIAKQLSNANCDFCWYIIGPKGGSKDEYQKLTKNIEDYQVVDCVKYLGEKENPYCYISQASLLVNTSISEACPYVINEAKILGIPVVCTDFGSASEFVEDDRSGYISQIHDMNKILYTLATDRKIYEKIKSTSVRFRYDNEGILEQICQLL